jgi:hypothetical protein
MLSQRVIERITGILLLAVIGTLLGAFVVSPIQVDASRAGIGQSLRALANDPGAHRINMAFFLAGSLIVIVAAGGMYLTFRPNGRDLALFGAIGLIAGGVLQAVSNGLAIVLADIAQDYAAANGAQAAALETIARSFTQAGDVLLNAAFTAVGVGTFAFGILIVQSRPVSRWLGWIWIMSSILLQLIWFGAENILGIVGVFGNFASIIIMLILGGWLLLGGTRESASEQG